MKHYVKILSSSPVTHDTRQFILEKPQGYQFTPGQATEVAINLPGWQEQARPFTFTSLNENPNLELIIKAYPERRGVTHQIHQLKPGNELIINEPWGTITYRKPGVFLAGGTGITPFIAIFRQLKKDRQILNNRLIFSNKTAQDVILENELKKIFGDRAVFTLTREEKNGYEKGRIDQNLLKKNIENYSQPFYICGPKDFVQDLKNYLIKLGASVDEVVFEK